MNMMNTPQFSTQCKVRHCSQCQGDTEFYCNTCKHSLCLHCKERHVMNLDNFYHDVVIYHEKFKCFLKKEACVRHPDRIYDMYCQSCELPVCLQCKKQRQHKIMDIKTAYKTKRQQHREIIHNIRSEFLYNSCFLRAKIHSDIKTFHKQISNHQSLMSSTAQRLKVLIDNVIFDVKMRYNRFLIHRLLQQRTKVNRHLTIMESHEHKIELSANRPIKFLLFIKKNHTTKIKRTPGLTKQALLSLTEEISKEDVIQALGNIQIRETGKRKVDNECLLKLMSTAVLQKSVTVRGISFVNHISSVTSERAWISDDDDLYLTDSAGDVLCHLTDVIRESWWGTHTVTSDGELIYIDRKGNINKLSADNNIKTTMVTKIEPWEPQCVYCSPATGNLLVGTMRYNTYTGRVMRYNKTGQHVQTIQQYMHIQGLELYNRPTFITENCNGDIIVTDMMKSALVVTDRAGRHRFTYTGSASGLPFNPWGICTDAFSHILVYDDHTKAVQMIDKDGHFLSLLLTKNHGLTTAQCLSYDNKSHLLWVGSNNNTLSVYRYIDRVDYRTDGYLLDHV